MRNNYMLQNCTFQIGQKVRIKQWLDMPQDIYDAYSEPENIGEVGEIVLKTKKGYNVLFTKSKCFYLLQELEPIIKAGEQLMLFDI